MKAFNEIFEDCTSQGTKIPKEKYLLTGKYIVIDQGQNDIAGYTNNEEGLFEDVPAIIFGDHTRIVKYVDKPFFLGADGVKLLKAKRKDANYKYLYYALRYAKIPDTGYNRHFKWLKEIKLKYPDELKQREIVDILDRISAIIQERRREQDYLDDLIKARFVEMFGDPIANEKGWITKPFLSLGNCKNGMNFHLGDSGIEINCLGVGDFKDYSFITDVTTLSKVSLNELPSDEYILRDGDIVFVRSNGNKKLVGRCVAVYPGTIPTTFSGFCIRYRLRAETSVTIPFLLHVLKTDSVRLRMYGRGANIQNLNQQILSTLDIPIPPKSLQESFASFVAQVDKSKVIVKIKSTEVLLRNAI